MILEPWKSNESFNTGAEKSLLAKRRVSHLIDSFVCNVESCDNYWIIDCPGSQCNKRNTFRAYSKLWFCQLLVHVLVHYRCNTVNFLIASTICCKRHCYGTKSTLAPKGGRKTGAETITLRTRLQLRNIDHERSSTKINLHTLFFYEEGLDHG